LAGACYAIGRLNCQQIPSQELEEQNINKTEGIENSFYAVRWSYYLGIDSAAPMT
jgi:hypothetical protein